MPNVRCDVRLCALRALPNELLACSLWWHGVGVGMLDAIAGPNRLAHAGRQTASLKGSKQFEVQS